MFWNDDFGWDASVMGNFVGIRQATLFDLVGRNSSKCAKIRLVKSVFAL